MIDSSSLFSAWPTINLREFYFSPRGRPFESSGQALDERVSVAADEEQLLAEVAAISPVAIYLRVSPHTCSEYLICRVSALFADVKLIVEFYDVGTMFTTDALAFIFGGRHEQVVAALQGCDTALQSAAAIVVKMGGAVFDRWKAGSTAQVISYFPSLSAEQRCSAQPHAQARSGRQRRVLYAGSASARELIGGIGSVHGANIVRYFDAFAKQTDCQLDIINAAHSDASEDQSPKFAELIERFSAATGPYSYRRALPRQQVVRIATDYDIGICCAHYAEDQVMDVTRSGLPNRMMTYIEAHLPVIVDDRFDYGADLIRSFGAGAVVPAGDIPAFMRTVRELDIAQARKGVERLKTHMLADNVGKLEELQKIVMGQPIVY